ncbi:cell division transport system ATP-binding protein [Fusobacterium naviforme]|uniref:Cell division ATP-binding protein FtsE n=1 Tax=Moryella indoligenes TaxID=371674 RepID=A0AAE4AKK7_9FIRM|nr:cell division ATP-binding protein FtsE [Moryella indoligenes]KAB0578445.1 cell division ATP-binding protein FtsE [Fusobacterium naviforme]MDQ0152095.1 cell division transport system ATP-binding protein [Moryella indoligenes]PSL11168.1 cell division transport system ATP-binding protein [Fusobacterium naviforme]STO28543.1 Cell division ATP-binding protein FtsE [Fusobacterium naviforme]
MIVLENVSKSYERGPRASRALKNINLSIEDGEFVFIMGRSGAGKSTLVRLLMKETEPTEGRLVVNDIELNRMPRRQIPNYRRTIGVVFQDFRLLKHLNVYENVAFAQRVIGKPVREIRDNVSEVLRLVGLSAKYKANVRELSGGEQQRVAIARALVNRPKLLLADEPTGNLDARTAEGIMGLLEQINAKGTTVVVITHSWETVKRMHRRVVILDHGTLRSDEEQVSQ